MAKYNDVLGYWLAIIDIGIKGCKHFFIRKLVIIHKLVNQNREELFLIRLMQYVE